MNIIDVLDYEIVINGKTIKLFVENYSKADILNEALNQARVEEATDLYIPKLYIILCTAHSIFNE